MWSFTNCARRGGLLATWVHVCMGSLAMASAQAAILDASVVQRPEIRAQLLAHAPQGIGAGKPLQLGLLLEHQPQWHTYWVNPGDSGLATQMQWTLPWGAQAQDIDWPVPQKIRIGTLANLGYEGQVLLPVPVHFPKGFQAAGDNFSVRLHASWLVCRQECIPQEGDFSLTVPVRGSTAMHADLFEAAQQKRPASFIGPVQASLRDDGLLLQAKGLPLAWHGKAIAVFPETSSVFSTPALPDPQDQVASASPGEKAVASTARQGWDNGTWSALLPFSAQRVNGPPQIAFVLAFAGDALRAHVRTPGPWPEPAPSAPPAVLAATLSADGGGQTAPSLLSLAFGGAILAAFAGGLLLNLMPCVFPVLALKALGVATLRGTRTQRRAQAVAYASGVLFSMSLLGAALLSLRAGGQALGWGFHLQSPGVIAALATLFTLICLNLMDLLSVSKLVPSNLAGLRLSNPLSDAALSGVLAVVVASPCTAPFMGASLGLAMTLPGWQAMLVFLALGGGLALPYALVSSSATLAQHLPRPGPWMEHLRKFMVFPMAATVLWLVWVLAQMAGLDIAAILVALLLCLSMCLWALHLPGRAAWGFGAIALAASLVTASLAWQLAGQAASGTASASGPGGATPWRQWSAQAAQEALAAGQPVFIDFTAAWCITCQYNEQQVLAKPQVLAAFASKQVVLMRADWTRRDAAISKALQQLGRSGVPVYVLQVPGRAPVLLSEVLREETVLQAISDL